MLRPKSIFGQLDAQHPPRGGPGSQAEARAAYLSRTIHPLFPHATSEHSSAFRIWWLNMPAPGRRTKTTVFEALRPGSREEVKKFRSPEIILRPLMRAQPQQATAEPAPKRAFPLWLAGGL